MSKAIVGIIGGSGVYDLPGLEIQREEKIATPWGDPSDALRFGRIHATNVVFLPRHGRGHALSPTDINYRANIYALKNAGVTDLISVSACGSYREGLPPGHFVLVDQFVDRTYARQSSLLSCVFHVQRSRSQNSCPQNSIAEPPLGQPNCRRRGCRAPGIGDQGVARK